MKDFKNVRFKWSFREYQKRVLDNSKKYLKDRKINIVAAPGSGKTILGLELITRLKSPCIIFSPTITIRDQWVDRFNEAFLDENEDINEYFSMDLKNIKLLNSITYQALHSSMNKVKAEDEEESIDYSDIDLIELINKHNITTICLDEAHHLQNEWQKALEKFIKKIDKKVTVISLTATPPYDASKEEWARYVSICGEIDEEIDVPELVKYNTLCPHQDYIYFNYPLEEEINDFKEYKMKAYNAILELESNEVFKKLYNLINSKNFDYTKVYKDNEGFSSLLVLFIYMNLIVDKKLIKIANASIINKKFTLDIAQRAILYILNSELLNEEEKEEIINIFKRYSLVDRGKVCLSLNDKLKKKLASSIGKLDSIKEIVKSEYKILNNDLRMLILTDYIKKESVNLIGKDESLNNISIVTIFEKIRRENIGVKIGALSGSLVILPSSLKDVLYNEYGVEKESITFKKINDSEYSCCNINGSNKDKVNLIGKLFKDGYIQVLIGTKSLLGEGWDSPCINSLILASFVGSFMLSNQMRGRAIRVNKEDENKVANIWHLVTIEPSYLFENGDILNNENVIISSDYETLKRRFNCFVGPKYDKNEIESGIERLSFIKGPYNKDGIDLINRNMVDLASERRSLKEVWLNALGKDTNLVLVNVVDKRKRIPLYLPILELVKVLSIYLIYILGLIKINQYSSYWYYNVFTFLMGILFITILPFAIKKLYIFFNHFTSKSSIKTLSKIVLNSLKSIDLINRNSKVRIKRNYKEDNYEVILTKVSYEEENIFNKSLKEFLSVNDNPRYLVIRKNMFNKNNYNISFSLPLLLSNNKENALIMKRFLKNNIGKNVLIYTKNKNHNEILKYIKYSYVIRSDEVVSKQKVK